MGKKEENIKLYLRRNQEKLEELESGLVLHETYCYGGIKRLKRQLEPSKTDLFCLNKNDNATVVVEIKTGIANHHTFGQILYYLDYVKNLKCPNAKLDEQNDKKVRGIILARNIDESLKILIKKYKSFIPEIGLITYTETADGNFDFEKSPLDI